MRYKVFYQYTYTHLFFFYIRPVHKNANCQKRFEMKRFVLKFNIKETFLQNLKKKKIVGPCPRWIQPEILPHFSKNQWVIGKNMKT